MRAFDVDVPVPQPRSRLGLGNLDAALWRLSDQRGVPALTPGAAPREVLQVPAGLDAGAALADLLADEGVDLLVVDPALPPGPGLAAVAVLLDQEPVAVLGTTGGAGWAQDVLAVRAGRALGRVHRTEPPMLLQALADDDLGGAVGLLAQAAVRRTPVLLGSAAGLLGAALLADRLARGSRAWWSAGCSSASPGGAMALADLGLAPVLDLALPSAGGGRLAAGLLAQAQALGA